MVGRLEWFWNRKLGWNMKVVEQDQGVMKTRGELGNFRENG